MKDLKKELSFAGDVARLLNRKEEASLAIPSRRDEKEAVRQLIENANESICIYCHQLSSDVYENDGVVNAIEEAYKRNPHLKVTLMVKLTHFHYNRFLDELLRHEARVARNLFNQIESLGNKDDCLHIPDFINIDNKVVRIERDRNHPESVIYVNASKASQCFTWEKELVEVVKANKKSK